MSIISKRMTAISQRKADTEQERVLAEKAAYDHALKTLFPAFEKAIKELIDGMTDDELENQFNRQVTDQNACISVMVPLKVAVDAKLVRIVPIVPKDERISNEYRYFTTGFSSLNRNKLLQDVCDLQDCVYIRDNVLFYNDDYEDLETDSFKIVFRFKHGEL